MAGQYRLQNTTFEPNPRYDATRARLNPLSYRVQRTVERKTTRDFDTIDDLARALVTDPGVNAWAQYRTDSGRYVGFSQGTNTKGRAELAAAMDRARASRPAASVGAAGTGNS